jgi:hypothetical protein
VTGVLAILMTHGLSRPRRTIHIRLSPEIHRVVPILVLSLAWCCACTQNLPDDITLLRTSEEGLSPPATALLREAKHHAQTRMAGTATGGAVGILTGILPGQGSSGSARAAMTGGVGGAGAVLGYAFGAYVDARNTRATMDQKKLSLLITAARQDAAGYEQDRINAERATEDSQRAVAQLTREYGSLSGKQRAYQEQVRTLTATAASLRALARETSANIQFMSKDVLEANDVRAMGDTAVDPEALVAELARLQKLHDDLESDQVTIRDVINGLTPQ